MKFKKISCFALSLALALPAFIGVAYARETYQEKTVLMEALYSRKERPAIFATILATTEGDINLEETKALFFSTDEESKKAFEIAGRIPKERRPVLIAVGGNKEEISKMLQQAGIRENDYVRCAGIPPYEEAPYLLWYENGKEMKLVNSDLMGHLIEAKYPVLLASAELPKKGGASDHNAMRAMAEIDGTIVKPGEEFSFYRCVGVCTTERGFLPARSIMGTPEGPKWVSDVGGGICKASTLLNLAVADTQGLKVTEIHHHSLPVSYAPAGKDAAVARSAGKDYRFVNKLDRPIKIKGYWEGETLKFEIWGLNKERYS